MPDYKAVIEERVLPTLDRADTLITRGEDPTDFFKEAIQEMQEAALLKRQTLTDPNDLPRLDQLSGDLLTLKIVLSFYEAEGPGAFIPEPFISTIGQLMAHWDNE